MNLKEKVFLDPRKLISDEAEVVFVSDLFVEDYVGGAELTSEALIQESPLKIQKLRSKDVNLATLQQGHQKFWIFGNFAQLNPELIPSIVANLKYAVLEYDYKYCSFRSPEKHKEHTKNDCDCHEQVNGKLISAFYYGATSLWWMSQKQKEVYLNLFPFLSEKDNIVLSSVFSKTTLGTLKLLHENTKTSSTPREKWIVLGSQSWVKGFSAAKQWCEENKKDYEVVWNLPYDQVLAKLAHAEGFVYLPSGADTCPRMVIEAKLLGCKLHLNDYVQHSKEEWFDTDDLDSIHDYLYTSPQVFWKGIQKIMENKPSISGYTTTYNCISQDYPFESSIKSMLQFCDEVCVVDGGSTDGTDLKLFSLQMENSNLNAEDRQKFIENISLDNKVDFDAASKKLNEISRVKVKYVFVDWNHPRFAYQSDGMLKAEARKMCKGEFCWQMDSDEIVHEDDVNKISDLCSKIPNNIDIVSLPVIEYWGGPEKVRCDIQPWKWRLSRNKENITHGIPAEMRRTDANGDLYAAEGTDGCEMIDSKTGERLNHVTFHNINAEKTRQAAVAGNSEALKIYEQWFNNVIQNLPGVHHYSWYNIERKIRSYKSHWSKFWCSLYNKQQDDTAENNMFFDLPWSQVTDDMIKKKASELKQETGGWIWHNKWRGQKIPHISVNRKEPLK